METSVYKPYRAWDRTVRWFHWSNVLAVLGLLGTGLVIFNGKTLGIAGEAKNGLKVLHVWFGYVFAVNLLWRIIWAFRKPFISLHVAAVVLAGGVLEG